MDLERIEAPIFSSGPKKLLNMEEATERAMEALVYWLPTDTGKISGLLVSDRTLLKVALLILDQADCIDYWDLVSIEDEVRKSFYRRTKKSLGKRVFPLDRDGNGKPLEKSDG